MVLVGSMSKPTLVVLIGLASVAGCLPDPIETETARSPVLTSSRPNPRIVVAGRAAAARAAAKAISSDPSGSRDDRLPISEAGAEMIAGGDLELLSLIVSCALPAEISLVAQVSGQEVEIFGEIGLAPEWTQRAMRPASARWVSACVISRLSGTDLATAISIRGGNASLRATRAEASAWTIEEGAFFGDLFASGAQPIRWFGCRGRDADAAELAGRVCAIEDPATPGVTRCGLSYAGKCDQVCDERHGERRECVAPDGKATRQVVTAFLAP